MFVFEYIRSIYKLERIERKAIEDEVYSQLFKLDSFNWGGFFQNAVEKTIVNNYVKKREPSFTTQFPSRLNLSSKKLKFKSSHLTWSQFILCSIF